MHDFLIGQFNRWKNYSRWSWEWYKIHPYRNTLVAVLLMIIFMSGGSKENSTATERPEPIKPAVPNANNTITALAELESLKEKCLDLQIKTIVMTPNQTFGRRHIGIMEKLAALQSIIQSQKLSSLTIAQVRANHSKSFSTRNACIQLASICQDVEAWVRECENLEQLRLHAEYEYIKANKAVIEYAKNNGLVKQLGKFEGVEPEAEPHNRKLQNELISEYNKTLDMLPKVMTEELVLLPISKK